MGQRQVKTSREHIQSLAAATPLQAIQELIENGLDAGGPSVEVTLGRDELGGLRTITVTDRGEGIPREQIDEAFGTIGDSKKPQRKENVDGRAFLGRQGKGRLRALALCRLPEWVTTYRKNGNLFRYSIRIHEDEPEFYDVSEEAEIPNGSVGTTVTMDHVKERSDSLLNIGIPEKLTQHFALYLSEYPGTAILFDGQILDVDGQISLKKDLPLQTAEGEPTQVVTVIEWRFKLDSRKLYLCNESGFSYHDIPLRLPAPGIDYTAYFRSPLVTQWENSGLLALTEMDPSVQKVLEAARDKIREHILERQSQAAQSVVAEWKAQKVYPYDDADVNPLVRAEQQVFDIVAVQVNTLHPTFNATDSENKRLTLTLIRKALESNPSTLASLLRKFVDLPEKEQRELSDLLQRTTVSSLIRAGSIVTQRLDAILAFEEILFSPDWKAKLLERTQLHRLLMHELWIMGEEFQVATDDEGLRAVLTKHLEILGRKDLAPKKDVKLIDGKDGIPDVMLWHRGKCVASVGTGGEDHRA